jgi:hypothetical protein
VRLRTYPQIAQLDDNQNVEQAKADGRNHLSSFFIGPQGQKIILPGTLVGWHRAGFTQKRHRKEATVGENSLLRILAETRRQYARLNENYKRLVSKLATERKNALVEAQRAWIKFRDANCGF